VAGIAGLFLPFLQGILFLAIGVVLLARQSIWIKRKLVRLRRRYPETAAKFAAASQRAHDFANRFRSHR
jgi:uncharacterized membrane protein YbaN (DUF454 family)